MPSAARFDEDFLVNGCKKVVDNYKLYEAWEEEYPYPTYDQVQIVGSKFTDLKQMGKITREDIIDVADVITGRKRKALGRVSEKSFGRAEGENYYRVCSACTGCGRAA